MDYIRSFRAEKLLADKCRQDNQVTPPGGVECLYLPSLHMLRHPHLINAKKNQPNFFPPYIPKIGTILYNKTTYRAGVLSYCLTRRRA